MLLSTIIPSYNCAPWLKRAVESALSLGIDAVEVIVVDDGSTDSTPQLCAELQARFPQLRVIRRPNGGLSAARNTGIDAATGEFICLLDADDELIVGDLVNLRRCETDILRIGVEEVGIDGHSKFHQERCSTTLGATFLQRHLHPKRNLYIPSCAYIYRRSFLNSNNLRFTPGLLHEDLLFTVEALLAAQAVSADESVWYRYFRRQGSITLQPDFDASKQRIQSLVQIIGLLNTIANARRDVDIWWWAASVMDYAWTLVDSTRSRRLGWIAFFGELKLFFGYRLWGVFRVRKDVRYRLRMAVTRMMLRSDPTHSSQRRTAVRRQ